MVLGALLKTCPILPSVTTVDVHFLLGNQEFLVPGGSGPGAPCTVDTPRDGLQLRAPWQDLSEQHHHLTRRPELLGHDSLLLQPACVVVMTYPDADGRTGLLSLHAARRSGEADATTGKGKKPLCNSFCHPAIKTTL